MKFSEFYKLKKSQAELDFVDINIESDVDLFIDPWAIKNGNDEFSIQATGLMIDYFEFLLEKILQKKPDNEILELMNFLHEANEIRLGYSASAKGAGFGPKQSRELLQKLKESDAVKTGYLKDIEDTALLIDKINRDKISDMVANIIRSVLIEYTTKQCELHGIPTRSVYSGFYWNEEEKDWISKKVLLPCPNNDKIILVPKSIVRYHLAFEARKFYDIDILEFEQARHLSAGSALCRTLKSGIKIKPTKKALKEAVPFSKEAVLDHLKKNPKFLEDTKTKKARITNPLSNEEISKEDKNREYYEKMKSDLDSMQPGKKDADKYHNHIIGCLEYIFYPRLDKPVKEKAIDGGRKRIDISFSNMAKNGFFFDLSKTSIVSQRVYFECKNYSEDVENPEVDQLAGRFDDITSNIGFIVCRTIEDTDKFKARVKGIADRQNNYIIALTDEDIKRYLDSRIGGRIDIINQDLHEKLEELLP